MRRIIIYLITGISIVLFTACGRKTSVQQDTADESRKEYVTVRAEEEKASEVKNSEEETPKKNNMPSSYAEMRKETAETENGTGTEESEEKEASPIEAQETSEKETAPNRETPVQETAAVQQETDSVKETASAADPVSSETADTAADRETAAEPERKPAEAYNGMIFTAPSGETPCLFTVQTADGSDYYVYMQAADGGSDFAFYVEGGKSVSINVPLGVYKLYYCCGDTWYGPEQKFGKDTSARTSDELFEFSSEVSGDYEYFDSWTVTLYTVKDGNMTTKEISLNQFPG